MHAQLYFYAFSIRGGKLGQSARAELREVYVVVSSCACARSGKLVRMRTGCTLEKGGVFHDRDGNQKVGV